MGPDSGLNIAIIGGAGVRTPQLVGQLAARLQLSRRATVWLMDTDARRLDLMMRVVRSMAPGMPVSATTDPDRALAGAHFVVLTIRVGGEEARIIDESVPLVHGCLGQETTGPGGMAMALRTIPAVLSYLKRCRVLCPDAWILNLTNPSGIITQAAVEAGYDRVVGMCDAPHALAEDLAARVSLDPGDIDWDYFGLNHLGWVRGMVHEGVDLLPGLLDDLLPAGWGKRGVTLFPGRLLKTLGAVPNEYCYFYYFARQAVANMRSGTARGHRIKELGDALLSALKRGDDPLSAYRTYLARRRGTYLRAETGTLDRYDEDRALDTALKGGYAGIALDTMEALAGQGDRTLILNTPNRGRVGFLDDEDIIEAPVRVTGDTAGGHPLAPPQGDMRGLVAAVKEYERLVIAAARERDPDIALRALMAHPLVPGYPEASAILSSYLHQLSPWLPGWGDA